MFTGVDDDADAGKLFRIAKQVAERVLLLGVPKRKSIGAMMFVTRCVRLVVVSARAQKNDVSLSTKHRAAHHQHQHAQYRLTDRKCKLGFKMWIGVDKKIPKCA